LDAATGFFYGATVWGAGGGRRAGASPRSASRVCGRTKSRQVSRSDDRSSTSPIGAPRTHRAPRRASFAVKYR
jgi:hypothetical protein